MRNVCPKRVEIKYRKGNLSRYDVQKRDMLTKFLKTSIVEHQFEPRVPISYNICYLNNIRKKITEKGCYRFVENRKYYEVDFKYQGSIECYNVSEDMSMLVTQNLKDKDMFNMQQVTISGIEESGEDNDELTFRINGHEFSYSEFQESFIPAFCVTVYKYQSGFIDEHYILYNLHKMDKKQLYTALSRTTNRVYLSQQKKLKQKYANAPYINMETVNSYFNDNYKSGQIYQITFEHNDKLKYLSAVQSEIYKQGYKSILRMKKVQYISTKMIIQQSYQ